MTDTPTTPPGWYPDGNDATIVRYWDGTAWTEQTQPAAADPAATVPLAAAAAIGNQPGAKAKRPWYKRKAIIIPAAIVVAIVIIASLSPHPKSTPTTAADDTAASAPAVVKDTTVGVPNMATMTVADAKTAVAAQGLTLTAPAGAGDDWIISAQDPAPNTRVQKGTGVTVQAAAPKPKPTVAQDAAYRSAKNYISFAGFSRKGLIEQLTAQAGDGYAPADAEWAVAQLEANHEVDWNEMAYQSAKNYLSFSGFSRQGLFEQLTSNAGDGYTPDQANYALDKVGLH